MIFVNNCAKTVNKFSKNFKPYCGTYPLSCKIVKKPYSQGVIRLKIKVGQLKEGCVLLEDVYCGTSAPLVRKNTVATKEIIEILKAYLVEEVNVRGTLANGEKFLPAGEGNGDINGEEGEILRFARLFRETVIGFQNEFYDWQSGLPVNVSRVKSIIYPLLEWEGTISLKMLQRIPFSYESFFEHTIGITLICAVMGKTLGYGEEDLQQLILTACLCDCGMALIPPDEFQALSTSMHNQAVDHPLHSYQLLKDNCLLSDEGKMAIVQHHERLDGSGYPFGGLFRRIHPYAKMIAIACELIKKLASAKLFPSSRQHFIRLLEEIKKESSGKLDADLIQTLQRKIQYSVR